jgi:carbon monoxide dehydrogenase subunit G
MLKKFLLVLVALVLVFVVVVALQPSEFHVERSVTVTAPPSAVFAEVDDFHKWDAWSPWAKLDPDAKVTFEGPEAGEGTVMTWAGNSEVGAGKMTLVESRPDELVKIKLDFTEPFEGTSGAQFTFKPEGDQTEVTWSMDDEHTFLEKAFCLVMNGKKMVGEQMEKGLAQLKQVAEQKS